MSAHDLAIAAFDAKVACEKLHAAQGTRGRLRLMLMVCRLSEWATGQAVRVTLEAKHAKAWPVEDTYRSADRWTPGVYCGD